MGINDAQFSIRSRYIEIYTKHPKVHRRFKSRLETAKRGASTFPEGWEIRRAALVPTLLATLRPLSRHANLPGDARSPIPSMLRFNSECLIHMS